MSSSTGSQLIQNYSVILFYRYVEIDDLFCLRDFFQTLCTSNGILGRILIADEGINGTVAGAPDSISSFIATVDRRFRNIDWKISEGVGPLPFNDLHIKSVKELISTGRARQFIHSNTAYSDDAFGGLSGTGTHLSAGQFHEALSQDKESGIIIDVRNDFEYSIGHFEGAVSLKTNTYAESWKVLDDIIEKESSGNRDPQRDKSVYMYCTGREVLF